jgi:hypothetical protein
MWTRSIVMASALELAGCGPESVFACGSDAACEQGMCVEGFCAFPDPACDSGHRYGDLGPSRIAGRCVPEDPEPGTGSKGGGDDGLTTTGVTTAAAESTDGLDPETGDGLPPEGSTSSALESSTGTIANCTPVFVDEFDAPDLDTAWALGLIGRVADPGSVYEWFETVDGGLRITILDTAVHSAWIQRSWFDIEELAVTANELVPSPSTAYGFIELGVDATPHRIELQGTTLRILADSVELGTLAHDALEHEWLRVSSVGGEVRYEASPDGSSWNELHAVAMPETASGYSVRVGVAFSEPVASDPTLLVDHVSVCSW